MEDDAALFKKVFGVTKEELDAVMERDRIKELEKDYFSSPIHPVNDWLTERLNPERILEPKKFNVTSLTGKNILISPEGQGKSTSTLNSLFKCSNFIYSAHTISNAIEKYESLLRSVPYDEPNSLFLFLSDSEIFRNIVRNRDEQLYNLFLKGVSDYETTKFIKFDVYSRIRETGDIKLLRKTNTTQLSGGYDVERTSGSYNSAVLAEIYNKFCLRKGSKSKFDYFIVYQLVNTLEETQAPFLVDMEDLFQTAGVNVPYLNENVLLGYGMRVCMLSDEDIKACKYELMARDNKIKEIITPENKNKIAIITQNKVLENKIYPLLNKLGMLDNFTLVLDELPIDMINVLDTYSMKKLRRIINIVNKKGMEGLTPSDTFYLQDMDLYQVVKKQADAKQSIRLNLGTACMLSDNLGGAGHFLSTPRIHTRFSAFPNTLVLTAEKLLPSVLVKVLGYKAHLYSEMSQDDSDILSFYPLKHLTKKNSEEIKELSSLYREAKGKTYAETVVIGTSYFDTNISIDACKGRNLCMDTDHIAVIKNRDNADKFRKIALAICELEHVPYTNDLVHNVALAHTIDTLNQVLGRFCGHRKQYRQKVKQSKDKIDFYYNPSDPFTKEALAAGLLRYKGQFPKKDEYDNIIELQNIRKELKQNRDLFVVFSNLLDLKDKNSFNETVVTMLEKCEVPEFIDKQDHMYTLATYMKTNNLTPKGVIDKVFAYASMLVENLRSVDHPVKKYLLNAYKTDDDFLILNMFPTLRSLVNMQTEWKEGKLTAEILLQNLTLAFEAEKTNNTKTSIDNIKYLAINFFSEHVYNRKTQTYLYKNIFSIPTLQHYHMYSNTMIDVANETMFEKEKPYLATCYGIKFGIASFDPAFKSAKANSERKKLSKSKYISAICNRIKAQLVMYVLFKNKKEYLEEIFMEIHNNNMLKAKEHGVAFTDPAIANARFKKDLSFLTAAQFVEKYFNCMWNQCITRYARHIATEDMRESVKRFLDDPKNNTHLYITLYYTKYLENEKNPFGKRVAKQININRHTQRTFFADYFTGKHFTDICPIKQKDKIKKLLKDEFSKNAYAQACVRYTRIASCLLMNAPSSFKEAVDLTRARATLCVARKFLGKVYMCNPENPRFLDYTTLKTTCSMEETLLQASG